VSETGTKPESRNAFERLVTQLARAMTGDGMHPMTQAEFSQDVAAVRTALTGMSRPRGGLVDALEESGIAYGEGDEFGAAGRLNAARAELLAYISELEADRGRLDWLEAFVNREGGLVLHTGEHWESVSLGDFVGLGLRPDNADRTLREALDAARSPESKTEGAKP
jgi:hypothetical protein